MNIEAAESFAELRFPLAGIDLSTSLEFQAFRPVGERYEPTTPGGVNVRGFEARGNRVRGGSRGGLTRHPIGRVASWVIQDLAFMVGGDVEINQAGRLVTLAAVSQGKVFYVNPGDTVWTEATNNTGNTPPLNLTGVLFSSALNQKLWFADGTNWCYYDAVTTSVETWTASAGLRPVDSDNNAPRLICTWRGRIVLSGLPKDPQNWFMSAVGDPTDFDYSPLSVTPAQAIAGNNAPAGIVGDVITTLIPYSDDTLVFGGDHTIYMMRGDPMMGGQIDLISDVIGMAWGMPWCKDPYGTIYFFSNRCGIYTLVPGQQPVRISQQIEQLVRDVNTGTNSIRLLWDDSEQGLHVFITPLAEPAATTHLFYEQRSNAWWQDRFGNTNHDPLCCCVYDGNEAGDRVSLIGCWDGYVRKFDPDASDDDGTPIESEVTIGPILTKDFDDILLKDLQAIMANGSGDVRFAVHVGSTAEEALGSEPVVEGTWEENRNLLTMVRASGHAIYIKLTSDVPWAMEAIRARIAGQGKVRRRGR